VRKGRNKQILPEGNRRNDDGGDVDKSTEQRKIAKRIEKNGKCCYLFQRWKVGRKKKEDKQKLGNE
jgi:hypothetical protein